MSPSKLDENQSAIPEVLPDAGPDALPNEGAVISEKAIIEEAEDIIYKAPKKKIRLKRIIIPVVVIALIAAVAFYVLNLRRNPVAQGSIAYTNYTVETRDLTLTLSGTGSLSPADSYTVTTLISGEILSAPFEEGDIVEKGVLLYEVDSKDAATSIEQAEISLAQSQRSYSQKVESLEDLKIKASVAGEIIELNVKAGDKVSAGQTVATIRDRATMALVIPFGSDDVLGFYIGQSAEVTLDGSFEVLIGTITEIGAVEERLDGNRLIKNVTIDVSNPGGIAVGQAATAIVGDAACAGSGTFDYKAEKTVTASAAGEVSALHVKEGDRVTENQLLISLDSQTVLNDIANSADSLRNSELSLQNRYDQLDDYSITSPISGTVIEKHYKQGDTLEGGKTLCVIFDLSYLTMTLNVDELDVANVKAGQPVVITAEALSNRTFEGTVTKVNINGTTSNGVTFYPVTIRIDETDGLLPGMNVQAEIVVSESKDTIAVPVSALSRGNLILVKSDEPGNRPEGAPGNRPEGAPGNERPSGFAGGANLPEGFTLVMVTTGINDGEYIEITSGLEVGDIIAYIEDTIVPDDTQFGFGFQGGRQQPMPAGDFQSGGMQGNSTYIVRGG